MIENKLRLARVLGGMTQATLSLESGVHYTTISRLERGMVRPARDQGKRIANVLRVPIEWLFPEEHKSGK